MMIVLDIVDRVFLTIIVSMKIVMTGTVFMLIEILYGGYMAFF